MTTTTAPQRPDLGFSSRKVDRRIFVSRGLCCSGDEESQSKKPKYRVDCIVSFAASRLVWFPPLMLSPPAPVLRSRDTRHAGGLFPPSQLVRLNVLTLFFYAAEQVKVLSAEQHPLERANCVSFC